MLRWLSFNDDVATIMLTWLFKIIKIMENQTKDSVSGIDIAETRVHVDHHVPAEEIDVESKFLRLGHAHICLSNQNRAPRRVEGDMQGSGVEREGSIDAI